MTPDLRALGPIPEIGFILQLTGLSGAFGMAAAMWVFSRNRDPDQRWMVATGWAVAGLGVGSVLVVSHLIAGVP